MPHGCAKVQLIFEGRPTATRGTNDRNLALLRSSFSPGISTGQTKWPKVAPVDTRLTAQGVSTLATERRGRDPSPGELAFPGLTLPGQASVGLESVGAGRLGLG